VLLQQVLNLQQVLPKLSRQEVSLAKDKVEGIRTSEEKGLLQSVCVVMCLSQGELDAAGCILGMEEAKQQDFLLWCPLESSKEQSTEVSRFGPGHTHF
jgi:hypothetical protein